MVRAKVVGVKFIIFYPPIGATKRILLHSLARVNRVPRNSNVEV